MPGVLPLPPFEDSQQQNREQQRIKSPAMKAYTALAPPRIGSGNCGYRIGARSRLCLGVVHDGRRGFPIGPVADHAALFGRQPHKLESTTKPVVITNEGARADGWANIRQA